MAGFVIYNGFWNAAPPDPVSRLIVAAEGRGVTLTALPNTACVQSVSPLAVSRTDGVFSVADFVLFWDKDTRLAATLEQVGVRVYNTAAAVKACDDKSETHRILSAAGIPQPETLLSPMAYTEVGESIVTFLNTAAARLGFPMVVKECYGSLGDQVYLVQSADELSRRAYAMQHRPFLLQRFLSEAAGHDVRLYVVGDRVVAAMRRSNTADFRANIAAGGTAEVYVPTEEDTVLALCCCRVLGLDFGGVDLLHTADGPVVCEVNSNAHLAGISGCTGIDVADAIVAYVLEKEQKGANGV